MEIVSAFHPKFLAPVTSLNDSTAHRSQSTVVCGRNGFARRFATFAAGIALVALFLSGCNGVVHTTTTPNDNGSSDPAAPMITTQPVSQTVTVGQSASFFVVATASAPLSYQWQKNGVNIAGATSSSYTTPPTTAGDNSAKFTVVVSNSAGSVTSNVATLTVTSAQQGNGAPQIITQPASQTVTAGQRRDVHCRCDGLANACLSVAKKSREYSGATSASYSTPATATSDNGETFDVIVSNSLGTVTSVSASLTVNAAGAALHRSTALPRTSPPITTTICAPAKIRTRRF